jgi:oligopeptide transport system substrate-binding protein
VSPITLDPQASASADNTRIYEALFEGLCVPNPETCAALPGLAESWNFSPDFKTITFKLRDASWSDGVPIKADTVRSSWVREMDPVNAFPLGGILAESISGGLDFLSGQKDERAVGIRAVDSHTLVVELARPIPSSLKWPVPQPSR